MNEPTYKILIAEDDEDIVRLLTLYLKSAGYEVITAPDGEKAWQLLQESKPDLGIYDIMMPGLNGYKLIQKTREISDIPVLILSAKDAESDQILGLDLGADDYITKPFKPLEVVARVRSSLRRFYQLNSNAPQKTGKGNILSLGALRVDRDTLTATKNGQELTLTSTELKILLLFMKHPGRVYTRNQILAYISNDYIDSDINSVRVHISNLRNKIEDDRRNPRYLKTIYGLGYKMAADPEDNSDDDEG
ncbi:MAG: response regulator transcription factor [Anaerovoracaceae bacterium]|jgi:DNA-binding response OmpR family regulator